MTLQGAYRSLGYDEFSARAIAKQKLVIEEEQEVGERSPLSREPDEVNHAIVRTRQDMVLLASYLHDLNLTLRTVKRAVFALVVVVTVMLIRQW